VNICQICNNATGNKPHFARDMMFGAGDEFEYFECPICGCLQINRIPENLSEYYPIDYYSFQKFAKDSFLKSFLNRQRANYCIVGKNIIGMLLTKIYGIRNNYDLLNSIGVNYESAILDVGCGNGKRIMSMQEDGFCNLVGADPFIEDDIFYESGVKILKRYMSGIQQKFDLIILHHSFEHMPKPLSALLEVYRLLNPNRYALITIPVVSSYAWRKYGVNWVQLDAPRHLFLHTIRSIQILSSHAGFQVANVVFDSTEFQFWGSEQYLKNIPLNAENSYAVNPKKSLFSKKQIRCFRNKAVELNKKHDGDSACFCLHKT